MDYPQQAKYCLLARFQVLCSAPFIGFCLPAKYSSFDAGNTAQFYSISIVNRNKNNKESTTSPFRRGKERNEV